MLEGRRRSVAIRTIKTVIAAVLSLIVARILNLQFATTAPIIAILCIYDTRKSTFDAARDRIISAILGLAIATVVFKLMGQSILAFGIYLLIFLPLSFLFEVDISLGPTSVLATHLLQADSITISLLINEMILMIIGAGFATLTNIYAPNEMCGLGEKIQDIDNKMKECLNAFSIVLTHDADILDYHPLLEELKVCIDEAEKLALKERDNLNTKEQDILPAITLRKTQYAILEDMFKNVGAIPNEFNQGGRLARLLGITSKQLTEEGAIQEIQKALDELEIYMDQLPMPKNNDELKTQSNIYQIYTEFDRFVDISVEISENYGVGEELTC